MGGITNMYKNNKYKTWDEKLKYIYVGASFLLFI